MDGRRLADVGLVRMAKIILACLLATCVLAMQGCSGEVTPEMQKSKKDALQKVADEAKATNPREDRGSR